jgi:hypothetical protein
MIFQPEAVEPVAPFTGAILYPLAEILELARGIVQNLERHHKILLGSAQDRDDDEEEAIQLNNLVDINLTIYAIDPVRWKETVEENNSYHVWTELELEGLLHPRKAEEGLLGLCRIPRAEFVSPFIMGLLRIGANLAYRSFRQRSNDERERGVSHRLMIHTGERRMR